jgi:uncharacterized protein
MEHSFWLLGLVVVVGVVVGFINTLAGSGSFLSLPFLMFIGLPPNVANGTNRIGVLLQSLVAVGTFKKHKVFEWNEGLWLSIPAVLGSVVGAQLALSINESAMERVIGIFLILMFFLVLYKPENWIKSKVGEVKAKPGILQVVIFFFIGIYGGFIQAGVGFFLLAGLVLGAGFDLVRANAIKVLIVLLYTPFALFLFLYNSQVDYKIGLFLALGNMLGAYVASRWAIKWGNKFIWYVLLISLLGSALKFTGFFDLFF